MRRLLVTLALLPALAVLPVGAPPATAAATPVLAAVGDAACDPASPYYNGGNGTATQCRQKAVSGMVLARRPSALVMLGDAQYENGTLAKYQASYAPSWGRLKSVTKPVLGNHEWRTSGAAGHNAYFGNPAHYYAWNPAPGWRAYVLESTCHYSVTGACAPSSRQLDWLRRDLAANPRACVLAAWHHPRWSAGKHGDSPNTSALYRVLQDARAEVVLGGHDHNYQRFQPRRADGAVSSTGLRQFVVGTGGKELTPLRTSPGALATRGLTQRHGALFLTLRPSGYDWSFVDVTGVTRDRGSAGCR